LFKLVNNANKQAFASITPPSAITLTIKGTIIADASDTISENTGLTPTPVPVDILPESYNVRSCSCSCYPDNLGWQE